MTIAAQKREVITGLKSREYIGTVLADVDTNNRGNYKVNIPELQPHTKPTEGIWVKNNICKNRVSPSGVGVCGSYYPLQAGMSVIVKFFTDHYESGYVDRVISDSYPETLPLQIVDRDNYYQILRTPKYDNIIAVYEGGGETNVPANSIHVYFNATQTTLVIDSTGVNIKTANNINVTVGENCKITVTGTADIKVTGNANIESAADINIKAGGNANIEAGGELNLKAGGVMNIQGAPINLNGVAAAAAPATAADAPGLLAFTDYEYFTRSSGS